MNIAFICGPQVVLYNSNALNHIRTVEISFEQIEKILQDLQESKK